jgi:hypothetical protein
VSERTNSRALVDTAVIVMVKAESPSFVSKSALARLLGVDVRTVTARIDRGILLPDAREGKTTLFRVDRLPQIRAAALAHRQSIVAGPVL